jgi:hypothetical protein
LVDEIGNSDLASPSPLTANIFYFCPSSARRDIPNKILAVERFVGLSGAPIQNLMARLFGRER